MILGLIGATVSLGLLLVSLGAIVHMIRGHWRQIVMALNAEVVLSPEVIPPVPLDRLAIPPARPRCHPLQLQALPVAA